MKSIDPYRTMEISYESPSLFKLYYVVFSLYVLPFLFLALFLLDQFTVHATEMLFWVLFLVSLAPCGILGGCLSTWGLIKAIKRKSGRNKIVGIVGMIFGFGGVLAGLLGLMLIYVVVGG